jgi:UDP-glucuronate 4-epimerase
MSAPRSVLLTGGAGFIGSHVTDALLDRGDRVVVLDNFDDAYDPAIKYRNLADAGRDPMFTLVSGDIRDDETLESCLSFGPFDAIVHLAARAGVRPSILNPGLYEDVNICGTTKVLTLARRHDIRNVVLASSSSVYGSEASPPFREAEILDRPSSPYAATKRSNELTAHVFHHLYKLDITCLRFFTAYGPRQRPEMAIHLFTRQISAGEPVTVYGNGRAQRDYTYIGDIVDGVLRALDSPSGYRIYNLGSTVTTRLGELVVMIAARLDRPLHLRHLPDQPGDVPLTCADVTLAERDLGYRPQVSLEAGLDRFVAWYRDVATRPVRVVGRVEALAP